MKSITNHFCICSDNLRKKSACGSRWSSHLSSPCSNVTLRLMTIHSFPYLFLFLTFFPDFPLFTLSPSFPRSLVCICSCKSPIQMEVCMPFLSQFKKQLQWKLCCWICVAVSSVPYFQFVPRYKCKLGKWLKLFAVDAVRCFSSLPLSITEGWAMGLGYDRSFHCCCRWWQSWFWYIDVWKLLNFKAASHVQTRCWRSLSSVSRAGFRVTCHLHVGTVHIV